MYFTYIFRLCIYSVTGSNFYNLQVLLSSSLLWFKLTESRLNCWKS